MFGDIIGEPGINTLARVLARLKKQYKPDFVIANGENAADGSPEPNAPLEALLDIGVDCVTGGNHTFDRSGAEKTLERKIGVIRPENLKVNAGEGVYIYRHRKLGIAVINLLGNVFMGKSGHPFLVADEILSKLDPDLIKIVDFHAEATSEKIAFSHYFDGRISVIYGTHTHVQTADEKILEKGTGYITDVGMTGPKDSVIGVAKELAIKRFLTGDPVKFRPADGECQVNAVFAEIDCETHHTTYIERINF